MKNKTLTFFKTRTARIGSGMFLILLLIVVATRGDHSETNNAGVQSEARTVKTISVATYRDGASGSAVKASGDAYLVRAESGGRVTRIAAIGTVGAGAVVAELENSSQRAAVTQAQGVYEAAVAAAGGNTTSQATAKQDAVRTWTTATVQTSNLLHTTVDHYFTDSRAVNNTLGFRNLNAFGEAPEYNKRRLAIEETLKSWEGDATRVTEANISEKIAALDKDLAIITLLVDDIANLVPQQHIDGAYTDTQRQADFTRLSDAQTTLTGIRRSVDSARTAMTTTTGTGAAASNASIKQALGMLQAAQAAYDKTFVKTPIAGTVTSYSVKIGDIINIGSDVALITASDTTATLATTFVLPLTAVKYTPAGAYVFTVIDGKIARTQIETGLVTTSNITVTGLSGTETIIMDVRGLKEGDLVAQ